MEIKFPIIGRQSRCSVLIPKYKTPRVKLIDKLGLSPRTKNAILIDQSEQYDIQKIFEESNINEELKFAELVENLASLKKANLKK